MIEENAKNSNKLLANKILENLKNLWQCVGCKESGLISIGKIPPQLFENSVEDISISNNNFNNFQISAAELQTKPMKKNSKILLNFKDDEMKLNTTSIVTPFQANNNLIQTKMLNNLSNIHSNQQLISLNEFNIQSESIQNKLHIQQGMSSSKIPTPSSNQIMQIPLDTESNNELILGKKINRDPNSEEKKILINNPNIGNISCNQFALNDENYDEDIKMILNFANEGHPIQIVTQFCQKFKWAMPEIDTFAIKNNDNPEVPIFKTTISVKNDTYKGEGSGHTKKSSKKKAAINVLTKMLEDTFVKDTMKIYVKELLNKKEIDQKSSIGIKENIDGMEDGELNSPLSNQVTDQEKDRIDKFLSEYHQNNPLIKLNFFKNKVKIPFSFTFATRNKIFIATLFVGSEIYGVGEDQNLKVAKYKASTEGLQKILEIYGEDILTTKDERKQKKNLGFEIKEDINPEEEKEFEGIDYNYYSPLENLDKIIELINELNKNVNESSILQKKLELFSTKYERNLFLVNNSKEILKNLSKINYTNKSVSFHFDSPIIVGSFQNSCARRNHKVIDILFTHKISLEDIKISTDYLLKNFNMIFNSSDTEQPDIKIHHKRNDLNFDIEIVFQENDYAFNLLIRNSLESANKDFLNYLQIHNQLVEQNCKHPFNFNILRRLLRSWRRKFNLIFLAPEILDWIVAIYGKMGISDSLAKIFNKITRDFSNIFKNSNLIPEVIINMTNSVNNNIENYKILCNACVDSISYITDCKFEFLFM